MKKYYISIIVFIFVLGAIFVPRVTLAQERADSISVWWTNTLYFPGGQFYYEFMADGLGLMSVDAIENMTLTTEYGDIVFEDPISFASSNRYAKGSLMSDAVDKNYFWITAASGIIDGKKTDILKMIDATRIESYNVITDYTQLERINETIEFFELDRHFVDTWIIYDDVSAGPPGATTKRLLESARRVLLDSKMGQTIYNNDTFFYPQKDGIFLLLITDGATQGFKILKLKALQPKESGEIIFSFTCELVNEEMYGIVCSNPLIIENGVKISQEQAFKSNPIFLKALEMFGVLEPLD